MLSACVIDMSAPRRIPCDEAARIVTRVALKLVTSDWSDSSSNICPFSERGERVRSE